MKYVVLMAATAASISLTPAGAMAQASSGSGSGSGSSASSGLTTTTPKKPVRVKSQYVPQPYQRSRFADFYYNNRFNGEAYEQYEDRAARDYRVALSTAKCALERGDSKGFAKKVSAPRKPFNSIYATLRNNYRDCLSDNGTTDRRLYVAAFAEALASTSTDAIEDRAMSVDVDVADAFIEIDSKKVGALYQVARCAVVYSPGLAYKLFQTEAGSNEEKASLDALYAGTPECGNSKRPESITTALQRAAIAYAFYSWKDLNA